MKCVVVLVISISCLSYSVADDYVINNKKFPDDFLFGTATAAFQVEGGWDADGKSEGLWDHIVHTNPSMVKDGSNADVACDSYHKYKTDVEMIKYLGLNHYRFSISWPRILPTGFIDKINQPGVDYYKNLIRLLKENNIKPLVTMYHWDLPQVLYEQGGGILNESFIGWFEDYSRLLFQQFGDDVQYWVTFNEPVWACMTMGSNGEAFNIYQCGHNLLRAHAAAYHIYDKEFRAKQGGKISIVPASSWNVPATNSTEDIEAAERVMQWKMGWWVNPLYFGDYPEVMKERIAANSEPGKSRLPEFTEEEKATLKGTLDFFSFNTYASYLIKNRGSKNPTQDMDGDMDADSEEDPNYPDGAWGVKPILQRIQKLYNDPDIIITENGLGVPVAEDSLEDDNRITLIRDYLSGIRDAIDEGVKIFGYTIWTLMDNFEWTDGYSSRGGLYRVDFDDDNRTRTPKKSVEFYKKTIRTRCLVDECIE